MIVSGFKPRASDFRTWAFNHLVILIASSFLYGGTENVFFIQISLNEIEKFICFFFSIRGEMSHLMLAVSLLLDY